MIVEKFFIPQLEEKIMHIGNRVASIVSNKHLGKKGELHWLHKEAVPL